MGFILAQVFFDIFVPYQTVWSLFCDPWPVGIVLFDFDPISRPSKRYVL